MKSIIIVLGIFASISTNAQIIQTDSSIYEAMAKLVKEHTESALVQEIKQEVENKYSVTCEGGSSSVFAVISRKVKYVAKCKGSSELKLIIKSKFEISDDKALFTIKSYKVEF